VSVQAALRTAPVTRDEDRRAQRRPGSVGGARPALRRRGVAAAVLLLVVALLRLTVAEPLKVESDSMAGTLDRGDRVLVEKVGVHLVGVRRGDLVTFHGGPDPALALKRVVGLGGDTVEVRDAQLYVGGRPVPEPYVDHSRVDGSYFGPVRVPAGHVFVLGDNRGRSVDSRAYGSVPVRNVTGRVFLRLP
jgi:signal peptidase I